MTTITTRQGKGSALTYEEMDANLTNLNEDKLETTGGTLSGNLTFANAGEGVVFADATSITSADGLGKTYNISAETATGGANLRLTDGTVTDDVKLAGSGATTVTRTDANTITISSTDTNTTYAVSAETATGGANLRLTGSDATTDDVKLAGSGATTVTRTDANTITISSTDTNTTYTAGTGLSLASTTFSHADTSSVANVSPTSRTYVSGITFDTFGHVQTVTTGTETVVDTNTTYAISAETATGGANLRLTGSDAVTDDVKIAGGTGITVTRTDASTITITNTGSLTETDPVVGAVTGIVKADGAGNISAAIAGTDYLASYTETDPVVGAITGIVKANGAGAISAAVAGTDYVATETDPVVGAVTGLVKADGAGNISAAVAGTDYIATETDPVFSASPAAGITGTDITNWDTAYGWGDHAVEGYLKNIVEDTTPQLGANLDAQSYSINNVDIVQTDGVQLDTAAAETSAVGKLVWNAGKETVSVGLNTNCDMNIGQHNFIYGKATENIAKGQVVMFAGVQGDHVLVALADATATGFVPEWIIGIAADTVVTNDFLHITILGEVVDIDTATNYNEGDILWFDPATPGGLTATEPEAPNAKIRMAAVTKENATEGILLVRVGPSKNLGDLNDVVTAGAADNDFLIYNSTNSRWEHTPLDISLDTTPTLGGTLDTAGNTLANVQIISGDGTNNLTLDGGGQDIKLVGDPIDFNGEYIWNGADSIVYSGSFPNNRNIIRQATNLSGTGWPNSSPYIGRAAGVTAIDYIGTPNTATATRFGSIVGGVIGSVALKPYPSDTLSRGPSIYKIGGQVEPDLDYMTANSLTRLYDNDRFRTLELGLDVNPRGQTWGTNGATGWGRDTLTAVYAQVTPINNGTLTSLIPMSAAVDIRPVDGDLNIYGITGQSVRVGFTAQSGNTTRNATVEWAAGLRAVSYKSGFTGGTQVINNFAMIYVDTGLNTTVTNPYTIYSTNSSATMRHDGAIQTSSPLRLATYDSGSLPGSGSAGDVIAISNNGGKLAYWDTTNSRWSYVSDDSAV